MKGTHIDFGADHYIVVRETHEAVMTTLNEIRLGGGETSETYITFTRANGSKVTVALQHVRAFGEFELGEPEVEADDEG